MYRKSFPKIQHTCVNSQQGGRGGNIPQYNKC